MRPVFSYDVEQKSFRLQSRVWLPRPLEEVFEFFSAAHNLEILTPKLLHFQIETPSPIVMRQGLLIDYSLRLHGIPLRWRSEISEWEPPYRFVDRQVHGPYRLWHHEHRFEEQDGGTVCLDDIHYRVLGGAIIHRLFVKPDLTKIFEYRHAKMLELFGAPVGISVA
ncbi:MAG: SRPBCC family protein [Planctomycetota bacterium]|nr:SRPBCC family protein [Planctomycetota bacterium]